MDPWLITGLLQMPANVRAIMTTSKRTGSIEEIVSRVRLRMERQRVMRERRTPFTAFIGERGIRQVIGGRIAMIDQLDHLLTAMRLPNVTVRVIPIGHGWHPGLTGPFVLYHFTKACSILCMITAAMAVLEAECELAKEQPQRPGIFLRRGSQFPRRLAARVVVRAGAVHTELTTQQAADRLNVSQPYLIGLLEAGEIEHRLVGEHRRVRADSLLRYLRRDDHRRRDAADELAALTEEMDLYQ